mgnify:CR=1
MKLHKVLYSSAFLEQKILQYIQSKLDIKHRLIERVYKRILIKKVNKKLLIFPFAL